MSIPIVRVPKEFASLGAENCCFCFKPTFFWFKKNDVAVCADCAPKNRVKDVPTKKVWCAAVRKRGLVSRPGICV